MQQLLTAFTIILTFGVVVYAQHIVPAWSYNCVKGSCVKVQIVDQTVGISYPVCRLYCDGSGVGTVWPKPTGPVEFKEKLAAIHPESFTFNVVGLNDDTLENYFGAAKLRFLEQIEKIPPKEALKAVRSDGIKVLVNLVISNGDNTFNFETDEGYKLNIRQMNENQVEAKIEAQNFYGARNALETLAQLVVYDDVRNKMLIAADISIQDSPKFKHRGVVLDTSRSFFSIESIKRTIDALAMVKMNTFHWHITDSHSFPLILKSVPDLARKGAYSSRKTYTEAQVKDVVKYARVRGVRVIPEFDQPAHVGEGFQGLNLTACFNYQPWNKYCVEPPCGQFDPTKDHLYDLLEKIYADYVDYFNPDTVFHFGGDEVSTDCWNASTEIVDWMRLNGYGLEKADFYRLWGMFQERALERFDRVAKRHLPIILWTSHLTESPYLEKYLDKERYIIQIWTKGDDKQIQNLLEKGFRVIVSNYDALYFDCGVGGWVIDGPNWCSPYIEWQKVYSNDLKKIGGAHVDKVLGAEGALWSEQSDDQTIDARFWPRTSALAERLWADPETTWRDAEQRFLFHRERLVSHDIRAELIEPEWCIQNENQCPIGPV